MIECFMTVISEIIVGILVGLISSYIVARFFYRLGRKDAKAEAAIVQINNVLLRLKQLDPKRNQSQRPGDGVDDTSHWMKCISEIELEQGHTKLGNLLEKISVEMVQNVTGNICSTPQYGEKIKKNWESQIKDLYSDPTAK